MEKLRYGLVIFWFISNMEGGMADPDQDLSHKNSSAFNGIIFPVAANPFRADLLTFEECNLYLKYQQEQSICMVVFGYDPCNVHDDSPIKVMLNTYLDVSCIYMPHALVANTTRHVRQISPYRAVLLNLFEGQIDQDPVTVDVVEPIRNQTAHLAVYDCQSPNATAKVYALGILPNVYSFALKYCPNVTIQKKHFDGMPQLRLITFELITISALEPGTFTDLIHLRSLTLERDFIGALLNQNSPKPKPAYSRFSNGDYLHYLHDLHCACSFAWLRSFLKQKPYLVEEKDLGEVFIIGNYLSPSVKRKGNETDVFSVDCSRKVTLDNIWTGSEFSYKACCSDKT
ncbi:uncharacterized protein LOC129597490 isoform X2 [Paramacrobiotus metropolitanus]|uniref:uncharacterized protein LOC129597490 isoform X2 n=1 Tax=Paramacrobiotus metropolitanus TaxID=2943436 RepID=UPI0024461664|nr:uncharacterized protein LOC129597490 isoform X2 [Paramacrobiotus metropolitanus]